MAAPLGDLQKRTWRTVGKRWGLYALAAFAAWYILGLLIIGYRWYKTPAAIAAIESRTLAMETVLGKNLPPEPDAHERDATVAGVDVNRNYIRDDVELAIHARYPDSPQIRAAQLQYAMGIQTFLTEVFNSKTFKAAAVVEGRGYGCIYDTVPYVRPTPELSLEQLDKLTPEEWDKRNAPQRARDAIISQRHSEVRALVLNSSSRERAYKLANSHIASFGGEEVRDCDVIFE